MSERITVVLWKWRSSGNWKKYTAGHVNAIVAMIDAHLDLPCEYVLITDDPAGVDRAVRTLPLHKVAAALPKVRVPVRNAYRRVGLFADSMREILGPRIMQVDLDTVVTGNITPLADRPEPFVIWKSPSLGRLGYALNPSFLMLTAGSQRQIYDCFAADVDEIAIQARDAGFTGSDQAVISVLAHDPATVDDRDGIVSFRDHLRGGEVAPSSDVRMVSFMDRFDPGDPVLQERCPWIAHHYPYRGEAQA